MQNNFDIKKYDKKVALGCKYISEQTGAGRNAKELSALLCGQLYYYAALKKCCDGALQTKKILCDVVCSPNLKIDENNAAVYAEALFALTEYHVAFSDAQSREAADFLAEKLCGTNGLFDKSKNGENFACVRGLADYVCAFGKNGEAERLLKSAFDGFSSRNITGENFSLSAVARFCEGALNYASFAGNSGLISFVAGLADRCFAAGLSLNFAARKQFGTASEVCDTVATAELFSLFLKLYSITADQRYRVYARRVWYNGLQFCQRAEGCVGFDSFTDKNSPELKVVVYEDFEASCRYAAALCAYAANKNCFADCGESISRDVQGRILMGDKVFSRDQSGFFGKDLIEIPTMTAFDKDVALQLRLKVAF